MVVTSCNGPKPTASRVAAEQQAGSPPPIWGRFNGRDRTLRGERTLDDLASVHGMEQRRARLSRPTVNRAAERFHACIEEVVRNGDPVEEKSPLPSSDPVVARNALTNPNSAYTRRRCRPGKNGTGPD